MSREVQSSYLTIKEVAKELQVDRRTVQRYIQAGKLRTHRITSKTVRIERADFQRFVKGGR